MKRGLLFAAAAAIAVLIAALVTLPQRHANAASMAQTMPSAGFTIHIDALKHFGTAHPNEVAHHWCKTSIKNGMFECLLFDSDAPNARLVGVETIVPSKTWMTFSAAEKPLWHDHKTEIAKVHATLPGLSKAEAAKIVAAILPTHGKIYIIWDPMTMQYPMGNPSLTVLH